MGTYSVIEGSGIYLIELLSLVIEKLNNFDLSTANGTFQKVLGSVELPIVFEGITGF